MRSFGCALFYFERGKDMEEYNIFEIDYTNCLENKEEFYQHAREKALNLEETLKNDSYLGELTRLQRKSLATLIYYCNTIAIVLKSEFSAAVDPNSESVSMVFVAKELFFNRTLNMMFTLLISDALCFAAEPIMEDEMKLMIYLKFPLFNGTLEEIIQICEEKMKEIKETQPEQPSV